MKSVFLNIIFLLLSILFCIGICHDVKYTIHGGASEMSWNDINFQDVRLLESEARYKRAAPALPVADTKNNSLPITSNTNNTTKVKTSENQTTVFPVTTTTPLPIDVSRKPLLGENGTGILKVNTTKPSRVSDPISVDDSFTENFFKDSIKAEHNLTAVSYDNHNFYNSTFIGNLTYFTDHWNSITKNMPEMQPHPVLSDSHRKATTLRLKFDFPFYGHPLQNITVATGGFVYTGEHVHNWLAATQYIAPLMANFDTTLTNDSSVRLLDDGDKFTALWENVTLQEDKTKKFTFAVTLYKNGDIIFAYKDVPIAIANIDDKDHPVKVGISDAYITDRILFYARRKTIYEYHRVSFKDYEITNNTILKLVALPTCIQYNTCESCIKHETKFNCSWCELMRQCSSGTDRNKQDWMFRHCEKSTIDNATLCPAPNLNGNDTSSKIYITDNQSPPLTNTDFRNDYIPTSLFHSNKKWQEPNTAPQSQSAVGGVVAAFVSVILISSMAAWILYAFKNPHTRSGQLLIKYRPSQWNWRRGEARYTAATIHM